uniref:ATP synthase complex subunit 8 n=1 Tax=Elateridae sp. 1 ACP-2013 TaxID=1434488 RepID=A0A3G3MEA8_9COLE|nr:ATP synthase F0 subunit 8 [Elateridae sp. 1 ACP-2013]
MPQMTPLHWATLFIWAVLLIALLNSLGFFSFIYTNKLVKPLDKSKKNDWEW